MINLEKKYSTLSKDDRLKLAQIMKRKRLEMGITLEKMSDGICSTSYLSKIENCLVDVDDYYYNVLFERLNLDYAELLQTRLLPIDADILNAYLENDIKAIHNYVSKTIDNNNYCDVETELFLLLYNIINHNFDETNLIISKIEVVFKVLSPDEQQFFQYLKALYSFYSSNYKELYDEILNLQKLQIKDEALKIAVADLLLDYFFVTNKAGSFYNAFQDYLNLPLSLKYLRVRMKHQLQSLVLRADDPDVLDRIELLKNSSVRFMDVYNFYYVYYLVYKSRFQEAFDYMQDIKISGEILVLYAIVVDKLKNPDYYYQYLNFTEIKENSYCSLYSEVVNYYTLKFRNYDHSYLLNYIRRNLASSEANSFRNLVFYYYEKEYCNLALELGRYKELVKYYSKK